MSEPLPLVELTLQFGTPDPYGHIPVHVACVQTGGTAQALFDVPLKDKEDLDEIRWYLEQYWTWPTDIDRQRALRLEARLQEMGRALFDSIFFKAEPAFVYSQFAARPAGTRIVTIETKLPEVMRLPWELLADVNGPLFTKRPPVSVRRRAPISHIPDVRPFEPPLRLLMVIARPEGAGFIDPRSEAPGVLAALKLMIDAGQVAVDFLRPPTLKALDNTLRARDYHVVHFDGHGVWHPVSGLGQLAFERDDCTLDLVDAERLGTLLNECGVPLMALSACQSAQGDQTNPFSSIATRLIEAGVGGVLSMSHSVLVATTAKFMSSFYGELTKGRTVGQATDEARRGLVQDTRRHTLDHGDRSEVIELHDWFLPVLYQQQQDVAPFAATKAGKKKAFTPRRLTLAGLPGEPLHGFVGRARELLALERTFRQHRIAVLHGFGGTGKTALASEAAKWLSRTGLFDAAAFVSFEFCQSADYALAEVGRALVEGNFNVEAGDPLARIGEALRARPTLLIFDNFESALGPTAQLPADDLRRVLDAAKTWSQIGATRLLITTRDADFGDAALAPGKLTAHLPLAGLAAADALDLAAEILKNNGIERMNVPRADLERLLAKLAGHPLSLELVLPRLSEHTAADLCDEFDTLLAEFRAGKGEGRNESLEVSLTFSLKRLSAEVRSRLPALAVFQGGAMEHDLLEITEIPEAEWPKVKAELARAALIAVEEIAGVTVPYLRFHPTLADYLARELDASDSLSDGGLSLSPDFGGEGRGVRAGLETRYMGRYAQAANYYYHEDSRTPQQVRAIVLRELPNLRRALGLLAGAAAAATEAQRAGLAEAAVGMSTQIASFLDNFGRRREREAVMARVAELGVGPGDGALTKTEFLLASRQGETLLGEGRAAEAEAVFRRLLARMQAGMAYGGDEAGYHRCLTLHRLGRSLAGQGHQATNPRGRNRPLTAIDAYRQELEDLARLEQAKIVQREVGAAHTDLADALRDQGRYAEARQKYEAAGSIMQTIGDDRSVAAIEGQLGTLAMVEGHLDEARRRYQEALAAFRRLGEPQTEAVIWHQLGVVAQKARQWDEAARCYKESLALDERLGDGAGAAQTCNQLAIVARSAGRPDEAEQWYGRALDVFVELKDPWAQAKVLVNLASLLLAQGRLEKAEVYAEQARTIKETLDLSAEPWNTYGILAEIAERRGQTERARAWQRKEQETFAAFAGSEQEIRQWLSFIQVVAAACQGDTEALQRTGPELEDWEQHGWKAAVVAIRRILAGERDLDALTDGLDRVDALIIRRILEALAYPSPQPLSQRERGSDAAPPSPSGRGAGGEGESLSLQDLLAIVVAGCQGDAGAGEKARSICAALQGAGAPAEYHALGAALQRLLDGLRGEAVLAGLPAELAQIVAAVEAALGG